MLVKQIDGDEDVNKLRDSNNNISQLIPTENKNGWIFILQQQLYGHLPNIPTTI